MAEYWRVSPKLWPHAKRMRWDEDTTHLALYLLTCPHRTTEGLFALPKAYAWSDLQWTPEQLERPWQRLVAEEFIAYDDEAEVVLIVNAMKYQRPDNENQQKAAIKALAELPRNRLWPQFLAAAERYAEPFAHYLAKALPKGLAAVLGEGIGVPAGDSPAPSPSPAPPPTPAREPSAPAAPDADDGSRSRRYRYSTEHMALAERLRDRILAVDASTRVPKSLEQWANTMRLMQEEDQRQPALIAQVIDWCQADAFWRSNILSADKLRKQFDQLKRKMHDSPQGDGRNGLSRDHGRDGQAPRRGAGVPGGKFDGLMVAAAPAAGAPPDRGHAG